MKTIRFRGKRIDNGEWVYGYYYAIKLASGNLQHLINDETGLNEHEVILETVGQFTGLHDKNGKEIYEGDIVKYFNTKDCLEHYITVVKWGYKSSGFTLKCDTRKYTKFGTIKYYSIPNSKYIEVIGNIYEDTELLEK